MPLTVPEITRLLKVRGDQRSALQPVSPLEHALQCAQLAEQAMASDELIVAALLHDLGHLLRSDQGPRLGHCHQADELHPAIAVSFLRGLLPESVLAPIRLQFDARRHVCGDHPGFLQQPYATDAIRLSQWDDLAHVPGHPTPPLNAYIGKLDRLALPDNRALYQRLRLLAC